MKKKTTKTALLCIIGSLFVLRKLRTPKQKDEPAIMPDRYRNMSGIGKLPSFTFTGDKRFTFAEMLDNALHNEYPYDGFPMSLDDRVHMQDMLEYVSDDYNFPKCQSSQFTKEEKQLLKRFGNWCWDSGVYNNLNDWDAMTIIDKLMVD